jgi:hypothetical protein
MQRPTNATPTEERAVTSYPARRGYTPYIQYPGQAVNDVEGAVDIHCHAHFGQQDALSLAKLASQSKMGGILYKSMGKRGEPPMGSLKELRDDLQRWSDETGIAPIKAWAGWALVRNNRPPDLEKLRAQLEAGVTAVWLPIANSAHTYSKVGGRNSWWDPTANPKDHSDPLPWDEAKRVGFYMLDDAGKLKTEYSETIRMVAHYGRALFYGHPSHDELFAVTELVRELGIDRAVIDHPFSPFIDLTIEEMHQVAAAGVTLNFTYDELSPLLGVDPKKMYEAIRAVGVDHFTLSSDCGEPLFPNSVEAMRQITGYMRAFGMNDAEIEILVRRNPSRIAGAELGALATLV